MCSATWKFRDGGYELGFNRDEQWSRPPSRPPILERDHPVPGACARDGGAGGTWLFTNERGITLAVMNAYPDGATPAPGKISRGQIPILAAAAATVDEIERILMEVPWANFAPCHLLMVAASGARHYGWDGSAFSRRPPPVGTFLTTSSVACAEVGRARQARFRELEGLPVDAILDDTVAGVPAAAIRVTRQDGGTVSRTLVIVDRHEIRFAVARWGGEFHEIAFRRRP